MKTEIIKTVITSHESGDEENVEVFLANGSSIEISIGFNSVTYYRQSEDRLKRSVLVAPMNGKEGGGIERNTRPFLINY
jgi:hypothetical protein